jgi:cytochrome c peroxidase
MSMTSNTRRLKVAFCCAVFVGQPGLWAQSVADQESMMDSLSELPAGLRTLPELNIPPDNPQTEAKAALGRSLFFDKRLSGDQTLSCGTCHDPAKGFSDGRSRAVGFHGKVLARPNPQHRKRRI